jgi:chromosome segregation protein
MLKSLELVGFKSFADRVRFDFGPGVVGVVGPNGSGKSNVVDALKWILGEQSPRGLRGKEMTDVIFNGSASRKPMGMAEASLVFDNRKRVLPGVGDEIVLSRRVFRGGESEYAINGRPARLKDFKELFLGTGMSLGAYSIIEQGKVEQVLSASVHDRRHLFEEAAGVSRFRAKKVEALRRLDRVEQNLVRAQDLLDELDKQTRSLRAQAGKAKSYRELTDRLRELRIASALHEHRAAAAERSALETERVAAADVQSRTEAELGGLRRRLEEIDARLADQERASQQYAKASNELAQRLAAVQGDLAADDRRADASAAELDERRERLHALRRKAAELVAQATEWEAQLARDRADRDRRRDGLLRLERSRQDAASAFEDARAALDERRFASRSWEQTMARAESDLRLVAQQEAEVGDATERLTERRGWLTRELGALWTHAAGLQRQLQGVRTDLRGSRDDLGVLQSEHRRLLARRAELSRIVGETRERRTVLRSRIDVLRSLHERRDGLDGGVQQALVLRVQGEPVWRPVLGVLAEFLDVEAEHADLVEVALGPLAQALLVRTPEELSEPLVAAARSLPGRVRFLPLTTGSDPLVVLPDELGASLATLVECDESLRPLVDRLLGGVILASNFAAAMTFRDLAPELRFITRTGELIEPDGAVAAGPPRAAAGIIARTAELRDLGRQVDAVERLLGEQQASLDELERASASLDVALQARTDQEATLAAQERHLDAALRHHRQRSRGLEAELDEVLAAFGEHAATRRRLDAEKAAAAAALQAARRSTADVERDLVARREELAALETALRSVESQCNAERLSLAVVEERVASLAARKQEFADSAALKSEEIAGERGRVEELERRHEEIDLRRLSMRSEAAELIWKLQALAAPDDADRDVRGRLLDERKDSAERSRFLQAELDRSRAARHRTELRITELRLGSESASRRLLEDYGLDLAELASFGAAPPDDFDAAAVGREADQLRQKIARLGAVNVQAVEQLEEVEQRTESLGLQLSDLRNARHHLQEIIERINEESRRLFNETFTAVRGHFQQLFRKLFGGGKADLVLEGDDVLEAGVEIIARPPGKEPRSLTLLSGGEKTMTAAALLMALFRSKPSPFCILDEVDAALDEANIARFMEGLKEFLADTQFILITHSKATMACADVLHGVTQRESGVSVRVSVRLDDIGDDGAIHERRDQPPAVAA